MPELTEKERLARVLLDHVIDRHPEKPEVLQLSPRGLDDLKAWIGVPNAHVAAEHRAGWLKTVDSRHLPETDFDYSDLSPEQQRAVRDQAYNLLFGMTDPEMLAEPKNRCVVKYMLKTADPLPMTVGGDVTVHDGEVYPITTPAASFNTLTIIGTGTLQLDQDKRGILP